MKRNAPPTPAYNRESNIEQIKAAQILQLQKHHLELENLRQEKIAEMRSELNGTKKQLKKAINEHTKPFELLENFEPDKNNNWSAKLISYKNRLLEINKNSNILMNKVKLISLKNEIETDRLSVTQDPDVVKNLILLNKITELFQMTNDAADIWRIKEIEDLNVINEINTNIDEWIKENNQQIEKLRNFQLQESEAVKQNHSVNYFKKM